MKFKYAKKPKAKELFEIKRTWSGGYTVRKWKEKCDCCGFTNTVVHRHPKSPGEWVCEHCGTNKYVTKYIATGHDHTDYSYFTCGCDGARKHGKPYNKLH